jgi:hypothetical protein
MFLAMCVSIRFEAFMKTLAEKKAVSSGSGNPDALLRRLSSTAAVLQARSSSGSSRLPAPPVALSESPSGSSTFPGYSAQPPLPPAAPAYVRRGLPVRRMSYLDVIAKATGEK